MRGALKHTHSCYVFLQEVAGVSVRHTEDALHVVTRKEIMTSALPGRPPRQAPRYHSVLLASFEAFLMDTNARAYLRIMGWWLLLQSCGTLRFDAHRGLLPADVVVNQSGMLAKLSRTKVSGPDKNVGYRVVVVDAAAYLMHKDLGADRMEHPVPNSTRRTGLFAAVSNEQPQRLQVR